MGIENFLNGDLPERDVTLTVTNKELHRLILLMATGVAGIETCHTILKECADNGGTGSNATAVNMENVMKVYEAMQEEDEDACAKIVMRGVELIGRGLENPSADRLERFLSLSVAIQAYVGQDDAMEILDKLSGVGINEIHYSDDQEAIDDLLGGLDPTN